MKFSARFCLYAGLVPLCWFLFWVTLGGMVVPGYSALSQQASELLATGRDGAFCLRVGAIGAGLAYIGFAFGVFSLSSRRPAIGAISYLVFGFSMISNGIWPMGSPMHGLYSIGLLSIIAPALAHIELGKTLRSRRDYFVTAFVSVAGFVYLWLNVTGNDVKAFSGLTQRVFSSINSFWPFWTALAGLKVEKAASVTRCPEERGKSPRSWR
jgi:hypothetical protein